MIDLQTAQKDEIADFIERCFSQSEPDLCDELFAKGKALREAAFGNRVYLRGLIEVSNYCNMDCYYCGIRRSNAASHRYRLTREDILSCCKTGHALGFRTFVLQGGEDSFFTDDILCAIISEIKEKYPDSAVTLSLGERGKDSFKRLKQAGADRYLLRHETANNAHYKKLHPVGFENRRKCLYELKELGFQTGAGFMVGSPFQTCETLAEDIIFLRDLQPHMVGVGPFIPHCDTPFASYPAGTLHTSLVMLAMVRVLLPDALLPSTTALGSIDENGRELGLSVGGNVVMPNLSPQEHRGDYSLYNGKRSFGSEAAEGLAILRNKLESIGMQADMARGDHHSI